MEHLENDMDDLFQKAGELYPLKITESDWDAVAGKLQDEKFGDLNAVPGLAAKGTRNKRKWLLLLIPLGLAGLIYSSKLIYQGRDSTSIKTVNVKEQKNSQLKTPATDNNAAGQEEPLSKEQNEESKTRAQTGYNAIAEGRSKNELQLTNGNGHIYAVREKRPSASDIENSKTLGTMSGKENVNNNKPLNNESSSETESVHESPAPIPLPVPGKSETAPAKNNTAVSETSKPVITDSSLAKKKAGVDSKQSKGLYIGFVIGPDISSVDFQAIKKPGFSLGAIVGYRFNRRLAIETGLLWDKKYYYSDGAHYKSQPIGYTINDVDGNCSMFEIPLALRYDFASRESHGFFAKAGFSSYLMRNQNYSANKEDSNGTSYPVAWTNNNSFNYFFSIVQLSGGYEFSISGKTKISIEPYVKIPLKGMGQGSMPISSAGIYFGITHSFR